MLYDLRVWLLAPLSLHGQMKEMLKLIVGVRRSSLPKDCVDRVYRSGGCRAVRTAASDDRKDLTRRYVPGMNP
jgi:hypothetical protein